MLQLNNISFRYQHAEKPIIEDFTFLARPGEIIAIKGDSGSGKTTLLNIICGVIPKMIKGNFSGQVLWNNQDIDKLTMPETAPHISLLLQEPDNQLFFPTVEQELAFGPENMKISANDIHQRITETLCKLGIPHLKNEDTNTLSFGQKKLVTFASILTLSPSIFLLDEISAGLSEKHLEKVINIIKELSKKEKIIILADHHSQIMENADRIIELKPS
ncbi:MAG: energy-coupling factor ABC transporter ATP-binding protein [Candidatus Cloacimonetes bacterium]|nr:energy-coupling factor ABC transporter ATP-binding protein [Candidatus Cloacimonadota bacterium]MCF7814837.1 energy-coupling factor ABC transporter ATP-binding protein [Candidatus Cloacimonadota bacterium]MCF7867893.1 energy-coupling factor ABC transporter ATP-binding protein [Candidatus Cloacimonadota bacterium]MCF7883712.1 energy-coupling factor ABC transporter ATP-binding protein [Candidatus Cloacimonadota bacterium]